jgi:hypothetical protein
MTAAFIGGLSVKRLNITTSPNAYEALEEVNNLSGLGTTNPLVDVTSHDSSAREYIAGLGDGSELTIECNRVQTAGNNQDDLVSDVDNGTTSGFQITLTDESVSPNTVKTYTFSAVCLSWVVTPSFDDKHMIEFTIKITGAITVT